MTVGRWMWREWVVFEAEYRPVGLFDRDAAAFRGWGRRERGWRRGRSPSSSVGTATGRVRAAVSPRTVHRCVGSSQRVGARGRGRAGGSSLRVEHVAVSSILGPRRPRSIRRLERVHLKASVIVVQRHRRCCGRRAAARRHDRLIGCVDSGGELQRGKHHRVRCPTLPHGVRHAASYVVQCEGRSCVLFHLV